MVLSIDNLVYFLFEKNLVDWNFVNSKEFTVKSVNRRNFSFEFRSGTVNLFIKQCKFNDSENVRIFSNEAKFYEMLYSTANIADKRIFPKFVLYDPNYQILILELLSKDIDFVEVSNIDPLYLGHLGWAVTSLHSIRFRDYKTHVYPWIFSIDKPEVQRSIGGESKDTKKTIDIIIKNTISELKGVSNKYEHQVLIHNDLKFENIIIEKSGRVVFIDLETIQVGDRLWDVASLLYSFIFETRFVKLNLNISSYDIYHPIRDNQALVNMLRSLFFKNFPIDMLENQVKLIQFLGCIILKRLVERKDQYQQAEQLSLLSKEIITNPRRLMNIFYA